MYLINFSKNCFITSLGLNYPLALEETEAGLAESLMVIPFKKFKHTDFKKDSDGRLNLNSGFKLLLEGKKLSIVKDREFLPKILLLMSIPYNENARFVSLDGENSPEKVYSFLSGDPGINGISFEILMVLNIYDSYRFALVRSKRSILFYNISVTEDFDLRLNWENFSR